MIDSSHAPDSAYDAVIIGGGHNGLTCAAYLARAGLKTAVFERRAILGGAAVTEEFHPGFRNSTASYTVSLLNPKVIEDLSLYRHGLRIIERDISNFYPLGGAPGAYLKLPFEAERITEEFSRHSARDAAAYPAFAETLDRAAEALRGLILETPPNLGGGMGDLWRALKLGGRLSGLNAADQAALAQLFTEPAETFLKRWFEHPAIIAAFAFDGIVGHYGSPRDPGTAYVLLHHAFGEVNGKPGRWGHAIGGMGAVSDAIAASARQAGADLVCEAPVQRLLIEEGRAAGLVLQDGRQIRARRVIANINPKLLFGEIVPGEAQPASFRRRMKSWTCGSGTFRMNVALSRLPDFSCLPTGGEAGEHHRAGIIIGPSVDYMDRAYVDARAAGWSRAPVVEMLIPSAMDDSLAPEGAHVASLFCQHFAPDGPQGESWDEHRAAAADTILNTVEAYAPGFKDSILGVQSHSPLDLERKFGLTGGDIFHGRLSLDQLFSLRPDAGHADYRMPVPGLYLCGSGAHPGGGVTGAPGHNAAKAVLADARD